MYDPDGSLCEERLTTDQCTARTPTYIPFSAGAAACYGGVERRRVALAAASCRTGLSPLLRLPPPSGLDTGPAAAAVRVFVRVSNLTVFRLDPAAGLFDAAATVTFRWRDPRLIFPALNPCGPSWIEVLDMQPQAAATAQPGPAVWDPLAAAPRALFANGAGPEQRVALGAGYDPAAGVVSRAVGVTATLSASGGMAPGLFPVDVHR
jgi:hypothetical protein